MSYLSRVYAAQKLVGNNVRGAYGSSLQSWKSSHQSATVPKVLVDEKKKKGRRKKSKLPNDILTNIGSSFEEFRLKNINHNCKFQDATISVPPHLHTKFLKLIRTEDEVKSDNQQYSNEMMDDLNLTELNTGDLCHLYTEYADSEIVDEKSKVCKEEVGNTLKTKLDTKEKMEQMKEEMMKLSVKPFLSVCVRNGMVNAAHSIMYHYRNTSASYSKNLYLNVDCYNIVLSGWGSKRNFKKLYEIFGWFSADGIVPNEQTYIILLESLSDLKRRWQTKFIKRILSHMSENAIEPELLFNQTVFVRDQRERVLKAIRHVRPDYQPVINPPYELYTCRLLRKLNRPSNQEAEYDAIGGAISKGDLLKKLKEQISMEKDGQTKIKSIASSKRDEKVSDEARKLLEICEDSWQKSLTQSFERNLNNLKRHSAPKRVLSIYPYLAILKPGVYVDIMMQQVRQLAEASETFSPSVTYLYKMIAVRIMDRYFMLEKEYAKIDKKIEIVYEDYLDYLCDPKLAASQNNRKHLQYLKDVHCNGPSLDAEMNEWPYHILISVGKFLFDILLHDIQIDANILKNEQLKKSIPAFYTIYRNNGLHVKEEIKAHPLLVKLYGDAELSDLTFDSSLIPMVVPPLPWSSQQSGGYLLTTVPFIRLNSTGYQPWKLPRDTNLNQLYPAFDSLNQLGGCAWIINKPILDIVIHIFNEKGSDNLDIPRPPSECPTPPKFSKNMTKAEKMQINRERVNVKRKKADMYSLWCDALYKLSIANHFKDEVFWFPHNLDFRGRVYPCPPHLNHLGSDIARGILLFAKGKPLGKDGIDWLKIHAINLTGTKKRATITQRLEYANEILPDILRSADFPLEEGSWWSKSDEPWQTLACCMEITKAVRSPNPSEYVSHFPVHQDGSCNGLQHYAALGRDQEGAAQVNLYPSNSPQDVYSGVAHLVEMERKIDAEAGVQLAVVLDGFITRKVVKQTVMTVVYGVTQYGARLQILKQLKDIPDFPQEQCNQASTYLVNKVFLSLRRMFTETRKIQDWFTECARLITRIKSEPVGWVTPLGLPVVQPYHKSAFGKTGKLKGMARADSFKIAMRPNTVKQKNAFPPNFIHSLDSSHMMLTSLFCLRAGISFVSVHDCFWTHPCSVDEMNKICREQFVALHNEPILENLSQFFMNKFPSDPHNRNKEEITLQNTLKDVPSQGDFKLSSVLESTYFFS